MAVVLTYGASLPLVKVARGPPVSFTKSLACGVFDSLCLPRPAVT